MADSNRVSLTLHPPSRGRHSPSIVLAPPQSNNHSSVVPRSPLLHAMVSSPPLSPRLPTHPTHHCRSPSFSSALNVVDLLAGQAANGTKPAARIWTNIPLSELVQVHKLVFVDGDTPVEEACQMLVDQNLTSLLLRSSPSDTSVSRTFDYSDLTAFLLMVLGVMDASHASNMSTASFQDLVKKAREGDHNIPVKLVGDIGAKDPFIAFPETECLARVVEKMASGVHRIAVTRENGNDVIGVLSQRKVIKFFWENVRAFIDIEHLYQKTIGELGIGSSNVISINVDARVITALELMTSRGISSIAVVDHQKMLVGNISLVDVQYVARASSAHLLRSTCAHFLSVIKFEQGVRDGQDQVPVFAVYPSTTLAGTIAKLVATRAHRMWIVGNDHISPTSPLPPTTNTAPSSPLTPHFPAYTAPPPPIGSHSTTPPLGAMPPSSMMGKLQGVVSLTDILNLFARVEGLKPAEPTEARQNRRRSSSSSTATSTSTTDRRR